MRARLIRIGNSVGVRLAKPLLEEAGLVDDIEIRARGASIVITPLARPRAGWAEAAAQIAALRHTGLIDEPVPTKFDEEEWEWR